MTRKILCRKFIIDVSCKHVGFTHGPIADDNQFYLIFRHLCCTSWLVTDRTTYYVTTWGFFCCCFFIRNSKEPRQQQWTTQFIRVRWSFSAVFWGPACLCSRCITQVGLVVFESTDFSFQDWHSTSVHEQNTSEMCCVTGKPTEEAMNDAKMLLQLKVEKNIRRCHSTRMRGGDILNPCLNT